MNNKFDSKSREIARRAVDSARLRYNELGESGCLPSYSDILEEEFTTVLESSNTQARAGGIEKGAEIARYLAAMPDRTPHWKAACRDMEIYCEAAASRLRQGESEDPTTQLNEFDNAQAGPPCAGTHPFGAACSECMSWNVQKYPVK